MGSRTPKSRLRATSRVIATPSEPPPPAQKIRSMLSQSNRLKHPSKNRSARNFSVRPLQAASNGYKLKPAKLAKTASHKMHGAFKKLDFIDVEVDMKRETSSSRRPFLRKCTGPSFIYWLSARTLLMFDSCDTPCLEPAAILWTAPMASNVCQRAVACFNHSSLDQCQVDSLC